MENLKIVLITGAISDIGRAAARAFAAAGYGLVLNYRSRPDEAEDFCRSLKMDFHAPAAFSIRADVSKRDEVNAMFTQADSEMGGVDVLVNNAGVNRDRSFTAMSDQEWEEVLSIVLTGSFICSQEFARAYRGAAGCILNVGAVTALKGRKNGANYCSARAGVLALTKCMALELAPRIRVNTVTPGRIDTRELVERYHTDDPVIRQRLEADVPMGRLGTPEDVASMMLYLAQQGTYITGQNFFVDGGLWMR
jgi:3-oxoacyl-[acyl-carrier protein] reductase